MQELDGNGGLGGYGSNYTVTEDLYNTKQPDGQKGEDCGIINIYDTITVYAYGGAGRKWWKKRTKF